MKKLIYIFSLIMMLILGCVASPVYADFPEKPVGLVILDYGNNVDSAFHTQIYQPVKWAYHFPYYKIVEEVKLTENVKVAIAGKKVKVTPALMQSLAEQNKVDVLVVAKIYDTSEIMLHSVGGFGDEESETRTQVTCFADLYCYNMSKDRLLTKRLREQFVTDNPGYEHPQDTVKWQLSKLVNTMEGRPIIGADN